jgi:excisionase family DNA binding protein
MPRLKKKWMSPPARLAVVPIPVPPAPGKDFMNLKEAAAYFGVSVWSVRGLIAKGFITAKRIGKYDVVSRAELAEYWQKAA